MSDNYFNGIKCPKEYVLALNDSLNAVTGKWKLAIVSCLFFEAKRFSGIQEMLPQISPRMLSKELKELELNGILIRKVYDQTPVLIQYELTSSGHALKKVLDQMVSWGLAHREKQMRKDQSSFFSEEKIQS